MYCKSGSWGSGRVTKAILPSMLDILLPLARFFVFKIDIRGDKESANTSIDVFINRQKNSQEWCRRCAFLFRRATQSYFVFICFLPAHCVAPTRDKAVSAMKNASCNTSWRSLAVTARVWIRHLMSQLFYKFGKGNNIKLVAEKLKCPWRRQIRQSDIHIARQAVRQTQRQTE